jgi:transcriptional regulator with XRE-family HTH domain
MATKDFGELLRHYRTEKGVTQRQLADLSTLSVRALRDLEGGRSRKPRAATIRLIAEALGLSESRERSLESAAGLRAVDDTTSTRVALPTPTTPLVGREHELRSLTEFLRSGNRLTTVVGLPGVGKTHLALEVIRLHHLHTGTPVRWLERQEATRLVRHGTTELERQLAAEPGGWPPLLVLDDHDRSSVTKDHLRRLLRSVPDLQILVTSRQPVDQHEGVTFPLAPLAVPAPDLDDDLEVVLKVPSVMLLNQRIRRVRPDFQLSMTTSRTHVRICRSLDGIPEALALAADLCLVHSPQRMAEQLETAPSALLAASATEHDWYGAVSGSLLDTVGSLDHRCCNLLARMALISGEWSLPDAARMSGAKVRTVARDVHCLVVHGMVRREDHADGPRFSVLNVVRGKLPLILPPRLPLQPGLPT